MKAVRDLLVPKNTVRTTHPRTSLVETQPKAPAPSVTTHTHLKNYKFFLGNKKHYRYLLSLEIMQNLMETCTKNISLDRYANTIPVIVTIKQEQTDEKEELEIAEHDKTHKEYVLVKVEKTTGDDQTDIEFNLLHKKQVVVKEENIAEELNSVTYEREQIFVKVEKISDDENDNEHKFLNKDKVLEENEKPAKSYENVAEIFIVNQEKTAEKVKVDNEKSKLVSHESVKIGDVSNTELSQKSVNIVKTNLLEKHLKAHIEKQFSCNRCGIECLNQKSLKHHMLLHTGGKPYACSMCDKAFCHNSSLSKHKLEHIGIKPYSCTGCQKAYAQKFLLIKHMRVHTGEKLFTCNECDKAFCLKSSLTKHKKVHSEKPYSCSVCGETYSKNRELTVHMRIHLQKKPFSCNKCDKAFYTNSSLIKHLRAHREKSYLCSWCNKAFRGNNDLKVHMRTHTGEKPYSCIECDKKFSRKNNLTSHMVMVHTRLNPYLCSECDKTYSKKSYLTKHMEKSHKPTDKDITLIS